MQKLIDTLGLSDVDRITIRIVLDKIIEESLYYVTLFSKDIAMTEPKEGFEYKFITMKNSYNAITILRDKLFNEEKVQIEETPLEKVVKAFDALEKNNGSYIEPVIEPQTALETQDRAYGFEAGV